MVVPLSLLEDSSQFLRWRFTTEGLETRRASVNEIARQRVDVARKEEAGSAGEQQTGEYLTAEEESMLCMYYLQLIPKICSKHKLPDTLALRAVVILQRYYLSRSVVDYHPKHAVLVAIYLAFKLEGTVLNMPTMATFLSPIFEGMKDVDASLVPMLQQLEMAMLEGINFDLHIQLPLPALTGLQMDLLQRHTFDNDVIQNLFKNARSRLALLMLTDAPFVYQPAQISFTALHQAAVALNVQQTLEDYALKKFNDDILVGELYKCVQEMEALQAAWNAAMPKIDRLKQIDAKLALCRNAASDVDSVQNK